VWCDGSVQDPVFLASGDFKLYFVGTVSLNRTNHSYKLCTLRNGINIYVCGAGSNTLFCDCPIVAWCVPIADSPLTGLEYKILKITLPDCICCSCLIDGKTLSVKVPFLSAAVEHEVPLSRKLLDDELLPKKVRGKPTTEVSDITETIGAAAFLKNHKQGDDDATQPPKTSKRAGGIMSAMSSVAHLLK
jgi:hypothetical protein